MFRSGRSTAIAVITMLVMVPIMDSQPPPCPAGCKPVTCVATGGNIVIQYAQPICHDSSMNVLATPPAPIVATCVTMDKNPMISVARHNGQKACPEAVPVEGIAGAFIEDMPDIHPRVCYVNGAPTGPGE